MPLQLVSPNRQDNLFSSIDNGITDAFGRTRTSNPLTLFDSKQLYDSLPLFYDDQETSGSGTSSVHSVNRASTTMSVSDLTQGTRVRQTFRRFNYQPGKSILSFFTFVLGNGDTGITKRVGYFDDNNGIFLEQSDNIHYFVIRSNVTGTPVDTKVALSDGNIDYNLIEKLDFTKSQILVIDFEWLGVGRVRCGFVIGGQIMYVHGFNNANNLDSVYMSTPNLPVRYEISNSGTGGANSLEHICSTVISEGGVERTGLSTGISRGSTVIGTPSQDVWYPILSIRLKSTHQSATIEPTFISVNSLSATDYEIAIIINPTINGVDNASWVGINNSAVEYDISRNTTNFITGGFITSIVNVTQTVQAGNFDLGFDTILTIGSDISGNSDEFVLCVKRVTGGPSSSNFLGTLNWRELV